MCVIVNTGIILRIIASGAAAAAVADAQKSQHILTHAQQYAYGNQHRALDRLRT